MSASAQNTYYGQWPHRFSRKSTAFRPGHCPWQRARASLIHRSRWIVDRATWKPFANGSREATKIVLMPCWRAQPEIDGTMASWLPTLAFDPAVERRADDALVHDIVATSSLLLAASCATRAEVPGRGTDWFHAVRLPTNCVMLARTGC